MSPLIRVYKCNRCEYIDYVVVSSKESINRCSLCANEIKHTPETVYVSTEDQAAIKVRMLIQSKSIKHSTSKPTRSLGVKKRILRMLISLIELNKGKPVFLSDILEECALAGINKDKALHFIDILSSEGSIQQQTNGLLVNKGVVV